VGLDEQVVTGVGAIAVAAGSILVPVLFPLVLGAAAGGAIGFRVPLGFPAVTAAVGALALGGAAALVAGLVALGPALPTRPLGEHPLVAAGVALVFAVAGAAAQLDRAWHGGGARRARMEPPDAPESGPD
jgi:hypothetical protein